MVTGVVIFCLVAGAFVVANEAEDGSDARGGVVDLGGSEPTPARPDSVWGTNRPSLPQPERTQDVRTRDLNDDFECADEWLFVSGRGTLTNRGSETASYSISVTFHDASHVRFTEGSAYASNVRVGETVAWESIGFESSPPEGWYCELVAVTRRPR